MFRAMTIVPDEIEDQTIWYHVSSKSPTEHFNCHVGMDYRMRTLAAQTTQTPELRLVAVEGPGAGTRAPNQLATSIVKAFGRDWDVHGLAIIIACDLGVFVNLTDEIWSWIINVESGLVSAPVEPLKESSPTTPVLADIHVERMRQIAKWGVQHREDGTGGPVMRDMAEGMRNRCNYLAENGGADWRAVLLEEVYEAMAEDDPAKLRAELVQSAAVCVAWIEDIDSRTAGAR